MSVVLAAANLLYDALLVVTAAQAVKEIAPAAFPEAVSKAIAPSQLLLATGYCFAAASLPSHAALTPLWTLLWLFSTLTSAPRGGRVMQLTGLIAVSTAEPIARACFAAMTALLAMNPRDVRRSAPRLLCLIWAVLVTASPSPATMPSIMSGSAAIAAIVAFAEIPVLGFAILSALLPSSIPDFWTLALLFLAGAYLYQKEAPRLDVAVPLLMLALMLHARSWGDAGPATDYHQAYLLSLFMLPILQNDFIGSRKWLALPLPPMPLFLAMLFVGHGLFMCSTHTMQTAPFTMLASVLGSVSLAAILVKVGRPDAHSQGIRSPKIVTATCLLVSVFPGALLYQFGPLTGDGTACATLLMPLHRFFTIGIDARTVWWSPAACALLGSGFAAAFHLRHFKTTEQKDLLTHRVALPKNVFRAAQILSIPRQTLFFDHKILISLRSDLSHFIDVHKSDMMRFSRKVIAALIMLIVLIGLWSASSWQ